MDELAASKDLRAQTFTLVGYGLQEPVAGGGPWAFGPAGTRKSATLGFSALTPANLHMSSNHEFGYGGGNYFDSGGPVFLGSTDVIVGVSVSGDAVARALDVACRVDTPEARAFLDGIPTLQ